MRATFVRPVRFALILLAAAATTTTTFATSPPTPLRADLVDPKIVRIDGVPKEWPQAMDALSSTVKGKPTKASLSAKALIAYDSTNVYVAADVTDDVLLGGADHVSLILAVPGAKTATTVDLYPGEPGKTAGSVKIQGAVPTGAKLVEAPKEGGYTLEAKVPWAAIPGTDSRRVGLSAGLFVHDSDGASGVTAIVGTSTNQARSSLLPLWTEPEQALFDGLVKPKGLPRTPKFEGFGDLDGDGFDERVLVFGNYLTVVGSSFREGKQFYYGDLGVDAEAGMLPSMEVVDRSGDGHADVVLRKRYGNDTRYREMIDILSFGREGAPKSVFRHETALLTEVGSVSNLVRFVDEKGVRTIVVETLPAKGFDAANYHEATEKTFAPLLLPWGPIRAQRYQMKGGVFVEVSSEKQAPTPAAAASPAPAASAAASAKPAAAPKPAELAEAAYAKYKRERGVRTAARFELSADLIGGAEAERLALHGREVVMFGSGVKGGAGYVAFTLTSFASPEDISSVTAKDLNGDGKAEVIVRGVQHGEAPSSLGKGPLDREILLVYLVSSGTPKRVFGVELSLSHGKSKVSATLRYVPAGSALDLEVKADKPQTWTQATYPFQVDTAPVSGVEPLPLPWGPSPTLRFTWKGETFERTP